MHLVFLLIFLCNQELSSDKSLTVCRGQNSWQQWSLDWNSKYLTNSKRVFFLKYFSYSFSPPSRWCKFWKMPSNLFLLSYRWNVRALFKAVKWGVHQNQSYTCMYSFYLIIYPYLLSDAQHKATARQFRGTQDMCWEMLVWAESEQCPQISRQNRP